MIELVAKALGIWGSISKVSRMGSLAFGQQCPEIFLFFLISNQRTVINEEKRKVQVIHDDEQQETEKPNSKTKDKE